MMEKEASWCSGQIFSWTTDSLMQCDCTYCACEKSRALYLVSQPDLTAGWLANWQAKFRRSSKLTVD